MEKQFWAHRNFHTCVGPGRVVQITSPISGAFDVAYKDSTIWTSLLVLYGLRSDDDRTDTLLNRPVSYFFLFTFVFSDAHKLIVFFS